MKNLRSIAAISAAAIIFLLWPIRANADELNTSSRLTFSQPVEIPGMVLPAGTYVFKRADSVDPHVIQIWNADQTHEYATLETVPDFRWKPSDEAVVTFEQRQKDSPKAVRSWFGPGDTTGERFVYQPAYGKKDKIDALEFEISELRNENARQAERIASVEKRAQNDGMEAGQAMVAAKSADSMAGSADRTAASAEQQAKAADRTAMDAVHRAGEAEQEAHTAATQLGRVSRQLQSRVASLDNYTLASSADITFGFNSDALSEDAMTILNSVVNGVSDLQTPGYLIELQGFTDTTGTEKYNLELSDRRVESVLRYLVSKNIPLYRISLVGLGESHPIANNSTAGGREQNRRVEIKVLHSNDTVKTAAR
jgi:outer membrane protein OmpA-like peptidoglycan-associated protein